MFKGMSNLTSLNISSFNKKGKKYVISLASLFFLIFLDCYRPHQDNY